MKWIFIFIVFAGSPVSVLLSWGQPRNQSGVRIGTKNRQISGTGTNIRGGSGIKIGAANKGLMTRNLSTTSTTTTTESSPTYASELHTPGSLPKLQVGLVVPHKSFAVRDYHKAVTSAKVSLARTTRVPKLTFFKKYDIQIHMDMKPLTPSPTVTEKS